tara:strand:+ start:2186 stop:2659 length:474 start_codon:yes stop_codon:yes gene_type:complete
MKLTEEKIKQIVLEETKKYLEEIEGRLGAEKFRQLLQQLGAAGAKAYKKGHIPFTEPHRTAFRKEIADSSTWEVLIMVLGDPQGREAPLQDWPTREEDREVVQQFLSTRGAPVDSSWATVQKLAMEEMKKFKLKKRMAGISAAGRYGPGDSEIFKRK